MRHALLTHFVRFVLLLFLAASVACGDNPAGPGNSPSDSTNGGTPPTPDPWLAENAHPLSSLTSSDYSDLQFLKEVIGDRRIVQLGESGHGVAEFNEAKVRLIRFFHEEMGFDVIAFESDLYACFFADRSADTLTAERFMYSCPYGVWHTHEVLPLFGYIQDTKSSGNPLTLAGFDMKPSSWIARNTRPEFMRSVVAMVDEAYAQEVLSLENELNDLFDEAEWRLLVSTQAADLRTRYQALHDFLVAHEAELLEAYGEDPLTPLVAQQAALYNIRMVDYTVASQNPGCGGTEARDVSMAENITFLADRAFPNEKILIWAHNFHIRHRNRTIPESVCHTMGEWVVGRHRSELYTVGLYMNQGTAAWNDRQVYSIYPAPAHYLEGYLSTSGEDFLFLDLLSRGPSEAPAWIFSPTPARSWGQYANTLVPREQYDGLLFIERVTHPDYTY